MAYQPDSGSVAAWLQSDNASVISIVPGSVATVIIGGSIAASFTPPANQSVSGTVDIRNNSSVISYIQNSVATVIIGGSIAASFTPPANQSVSGAVTAPPGSILSVTFPAGSIAAVSATAPAGSIMSFTTPAGSVMTVIATNPAGSIQSTTAPAGSTMAVLATQVTSPWIVTASNTSIVGTYQEETVGGPSVRGIALVWESNTSTSVMSTVSPTNPLRISGSVSGRVEATQPAGSLLTIIHPAASITSVTNPAGSVTAVSATAPAGSVMTIATLAGSILSVNATAPAGSIMATNQVAGSIMAVNATQPAGSLLSAIQVAGSVMAVSATQGTTPWATVNTGSIINITQGSVAAFMGGTWKPSTINLITRNDTIASFLGADLVERPLMGDATGRTITKPFASEDATIISYTGSVVSASVTLIQASAVGKKSYMTDFWIVNTGSVAQLITFLDGSTSVLGYTMAPGGGGSNSQGINIPLKTANAQDLAFKTTGTSSTVYLTVKGYQAQ